MQPPAFQPACPLLRPRRARGTCSVVRRRARASAAPPPGGGGGGGGGGGADAPGTVGAALREWARARDAGLTPKGGEARDGQGRRVAVLFVGRDNATVSVAAEAIFEDMVRRRGGAVRISVHSAGTHVEGEGAAPDPGFIEALRFKRGLDVSGYCSARVSAGDVEGADLVVCTDEGIKSAVLYLCCGGGGIVPEVERKVVVLSAYCSIERLRRAQFREGKYTREALNFLISGVIDACQGLLSSLIDPPPEGESGAPRT